MTVLQPITAAVPPHIIACLNRATDRAAKVLRFDHGMDAPRRILRPHGEAVVLKEMHRTTPHPTSPNALAFLETVLCDLMVEAVMPEGVL